MSIMKKPVLLVVSFGTSFADALEKNITAIEKALAEAFPAYEVRVHLVVPQACNLRTV